MQLPTRTLLSTLLITVLYHYILRDCYYAAHYPEYSMLQEMLMCFEQIFPRGFHVVR